MGDSEDRVKALVDGGRLIEAADLVLDMYIDGIFLGPNGTKDAWISIVIQIVQHLGIEAVGCQADGYIDYDYSFDNALGAREETRGNR